MMYVRRLFAKFTNLTRHGSAEAEMNREAPAPGAASERFETKPREDFAMRTIRIGSVACTLAIVAAVSVAPSHAQPAPQTPQAALSKEAGTLSDKFSGLARVMAGKYDWKPGEGVRSVGDVFNLIVKENGILAGTLTGAGAGQGGAPVTDPENMQAALKTSYANLQKTVEGLSDSDLKTPVKLFGKEMTKEVAIRYLFGDQHEHLGQSIAYARANGVIPPWSK
jgi:uncharacterized damage-inducible protein DinB